jgi:hypothetical protein
MEIAVRTEAKIEDFRDTVEVNSSEPCSFYPTHDLKTQFGTVEQGVIDLRVSHLFLDLILVLIRYDRTTPSIKPLKTCSIVFVQSRRRSMMLRMHPRHA